MEIPENILWSKTHEYVYQNDNVWYVGISDYAVEQLGDIVFVELPEVGSTFEQGEVIGTLESVKAASEIYAPVSLKVTEVNDDAIVQPELLNADPYTQGWLIKIEVLNKDELDTLMEYEDYKSEAN